MATVAACDPSSGTIGVPAFFESLPGNRILENVGFPLPLPPFTLPHGLSPELTGLSFKHFTPLKAQWTSMSAIPLWQYQAQKSRSQGAYPLENRTGYLLGAWCKATCRVICYNRV